MNKGVIVGRLVRNPELRYTSSNKAVAKITIACNNSKDDTKRRKQINSIYVV